MEKIKGISRLIDEIEMERQTASELIESLQTKKPGKEKSNIVRISSASR